MSRVLALLGAVALIVVAVVVRAVVLDDDGGAGADDPDRALVVACVPELEVACNAIDAATDVVVERPDQTIARLAAGEEVDAWVTFDPWPAMAEILEARAGLAPVTAVAPVMIVYLFTAP